MTARIGGRPEAERLSAAHATGETGNRARHA